MGTDLIAETDEDGHILWVWIIEPGGRRARPVQDRYADQQFLKQANCHGASCASVHQWFAERGQVEAQSRDTCRLITRGRLREFPNLPATPAVRHAPGPMIRTPR